MAGDIPKNPIIFEVSPSSGVPIYRQLVDQVHALVAGGRLQPGDRLPSVRQVARAASVNPMTVSRAYSLLETEGIVRRLRGQGMEIVADANSLPLDQRLEQFRELLRPALLRAQQLGLNPEEIAAEIDAMIQAHAKESQP